MGRECVGRSSAERHICASQKCREKKGLERRGEEATHTVTGERLSHWASRLPKE